jgi:hypothetical protein
MLGYKGFLFILDTTIDRIIVEQYNISPKPLPTRSTHQFQLSPKLPPESRYYYSFRMDKITALRPWPSLKNAKNGHAYGYFIISYERLI